ncbi:MAG: pyridoxamine 5'-phosphate oxidase family protein [Candidatus Thorarchaeota archaeon]|nr:MAG: pyridoxamine 5'-phosphate oxidase family protein [Candidatus Thorarchaeota archaeon]
MKEYPESINLEDVWKLFKGFPLIHFATVDNEQPRVRTMALIEQADRLWIATKTSWAKVEQLKANSNAEFVMGTQADGKPGCLRVTVITRIENDKDTKRIFSEYIPWFESYWDSHRDPEFTLVELLPQHIRYDNPEDGLKYTVKL